MEQHQVVKMALTPFFAGCTGVFSLMCIVQCKCSPSWVSWQSGILLSLVAMTMHTLGALEPWPLHRLQLQRCSPKHLIFPFYHLCLSFASTLSRSSSQKLCVNKMEKMTSRCEQNGRYNVNNVPEKVFGWQSETQRVNEEEYIWKNKTKWNEIRVIFSLFWK